MDHASGDSSSCKVTYIVSPYVKKYKSSEEAKPHSRRKRTVLSFYGVLAFVVCSLLLVSIPYWNSAGKHVISHMRMQIASCTYNGRGQGSGEKEVVVSDDQEDEVMTMDAGKTERLLEQLKKNGSTACHNVSTARTEVVGLPEERPVRIKTDEAFLLRMISVGEDGRPRCAGGDYYEADLEGEHWKGRPEVTDRDDGTYEVRILVDGRKPGRYNFTARLLFGNLHGLDHETEPWRREGDVVAEVEFLVEPSGGAAVISDGMRTCAASDLRSAGSGGGRWTRGSYNRSCAPRPNDGRWLCLVGDEAECEAPWCEGHVAALESNGWVYSDRRCGFRIFTKAEAWECLAGKWLFMWGDSNMLDFLRNLLLFGLDYPPPPWANISTWEMNREVEQTLFVNPTRPDQALRVSYVFNGHHETFGDYLGLDSLLDGGYRDFLRRFFNGSAGAPDTFVFNSGLHDGIHFGGLPEFAAAVERAAAFWASVFRPLGRPMRFLMRTTVAPAGAARWKRSNPQKMEAFNAALLEGFRRRLRGVHVLDAFDATFPFHYDFCCSDGGHYGRPPGIRRWPWFDQPHHYFIEVMLVHMMLNSLCSHPPSGTVRETEATQSSSSSSS